MHACQVAAFICYIVAVILMLISKRVPDAAHYALAFVAAGLAFQVAPAVFELHG
jgi:hypothetical protein